MRVLSSAPHKASAITLAVTVEGEAEPRTLRISEAEYRSLGSPGAGDILPPEAAERLLLLDERHRARRAAARLLEFADNNKRTLARKLRARGFSADASADAVLYMEEKGFLREEELLERSVRASLKKLWGPKKVVAALTARGFARDAVEECVFRLLDGEFDIGEQKRLLLLKKGEHDPPRARALLYRYGYDSE